MDEKISEANQKIWKKPSGEQDAYQVGDVVFYNGAYWYCMVDGNVWAPGVYGWWLGQDND